jgi:ribulose-5-phosphate 4-epimerase/fuculose-1-phosphate aldolase
LSTEADAREKLAQCGRALYRLGLYNLGGHISLRIPGSDLILITPGGGLDKSRLRPSDLVTMDATGKQVDGPYPPPLETPIHTVVHAARPQLQCIAHLHPHWATIFSVTDVPLDIVLIPARCLGGPLPTFDEPRLVTNQALGEQLNAALGQAAGVLMRWHGVTVVGLTLEEMFTRAVMLEENARLLWEARALGTPLPLPREALPMSPTTGQEETSVRTFLYYTNAERATDEQIHSGAQYKPDW